MEDTKRRTVSKKWVILGVAIAASLVIVISTIQLSSKYPGFGIYVANVETAPYTRKFSTNDWPPMSSLRVGQK